MHPAKLQFRYAMAAFVAAWMLCATSSVALAAAKPASSVPAEKLMQPADLAALLKNRARPRPLILQVGFRTLYDQAHIAGAEYAGPANTADGLEVLRNRVAKLSKDTAIVIYCGCCPWSRCPTIAAAYDTLQEQGFSNVSVMQVAENFGVDWVDKGYPTAKGQ